MLCYEFLCTRFYVDICIQFSRSGIVRSCGNPRYHWGPARLFSTVTVQFKLLFTVHKVSSFSTTLPILFLYTHVCGHLHVCMSFHVWVHVEAWVGFFSWLLATLCIETVSLAEPRALFQSLTNLLALVLSFRPSRHPPDFFVVFRDPNS